MEEIKSTIDELRKLCENHIIKSGKITDTKTEIDKIRIGLNDIINIVKNTHCMSCFSVICRYYYVCPSCEGPWCNFCYKDNGCPYCGSTVIFKS